MENRKLNEHFEELAREVIETSPDLEYIKNSGVRIAFLESDFEKKSNRKAVLGQCEKVQSKNQWAIDYDYTITLYVRNLVGLTEDQIKILLFHELLHIGIAVDKTGEIEYTIRPHDLEDFKVIIDLYGTEWDSVSSD